MSIKTIIERPLFSIVVNVMVVATGIISLIRGLAYLKAFGVEVFVVEA